MNSGCGFENNGETTLNKVVINPTIPTDFALTLSNGGISSFSLILCSKGIEIKGIVTVQSIFSNYKKKTINFIYLNKIIKIINNCLLNLTLSFS